MANLSDAQIREIRDIAREEIRIVGYKWIVTILAIVFGGGSVVAIAITTLMQQKLTDIGTVANEKKVEIGKVVEEKKAEFRGFAVTTQLDLKKINPQDIAPQVAESIAGDEKLRARLVQGLVRTGTPYRVKATDEASFLARRPSNEVEITERKADSSRWTLEEAGK
jgi:hypothetical protein